MPPATVNEALFDESVRHQVYLTRFSRGMLKSLIKVLSRADRDIVEKINAMGDAAPATWSKKRLESLLVAVRKINVRAYDRFHDGLKTRLQDFATVEGDYIAHKIVAAIPVKLDVITPTEDQLASIVTQDPLRGKYVREFVDELSESRYVKLRDAIRTGVVEGETIDQMVTRIRGTRAANYADGLLDIGRRDAEMIVRTSVNHVSTRAKERVYSANSDLISGVQWVSTLDGRTCFVAGTLVETPDGLRPIDQLAAGDWVIGGSREPRKVTATTQVARYRVLKIRLSNGSILRCTPDHLFYRPTGCWTEAQHLIVGDVLARQLQMPLVRNHVRGLQAEPLLHDQLLSFSAAARRISVGSGALQSGEAMPSLRLVGRAFNGKIANWKSQRQGFLFSSMLRSVADRGARKLCRLCDSIEAWGTQILFATMQGEPQEATAAFMRELWNDVLTSETDQKITRHFDGRSQQRENVFSGVRGGVGVEQRGAQAKDQCGVYGRTASKLAWWLSIWKIARTWVACDQTEGAETRWLPVPRLRGFRGRVLGTLRAVTGRRSYHSVLQLHVANKSKSSHESSCALRILPSQSRGSADERAADISVVEISAEVGETTVYDIEVEVDRSFIVGGVVAHNSAICRARDGKVFPVDEGPRPPAHPNCLAADSLITAGPLVTAGFKRWYDGDLLIFRTAAGKSLACTPNHPILTKRGWVAAHLIDKGDYVIGYRWRNRVSSLVDDNNQDMPASIEKITETLFASQKMRAVPVPTSTEDFHGDGTDGEIAIVATNRLLANCFDIQVGEQGLKSALVFRNVRHAQLSSKSALAEFRFAWSATTIGVLSWLRQRFAFIWRSFCHAGELLLRPISQSAAVGPQNAFDWMRAHFEIIGDSTNASPLVEHGNDLLAWQRDARRPCGWPQGFTEFVKSTHDSVAADADLAAYLLSGQAGAVEFDKVTKIERRDFRGHVFNLETEGGWYVANGIITHNCRSTTAPVIKSWQELGFDLPDATKGERESMDGAVAEDVTYGEWLRKQDREFVEDVMGNDKAKLFLDGNLSIDRFVDDGGHELTLDELRAKNAKEWRRAFG